MRTSFIVASMILLIALSQAALAATLTIRPNSQGYYSAWTNHGCGSGSNEWKCVDEAVVNTTDYLDTNSKNDKESFGFSDSGQSGYAINSLTLYYYAKYYSSSKYYAQPLIRSSSTDYLGNTFTLTSSYAYYKQKYSTNPATGSAWTWAQVDALEAGMNSYSSNNAGGNVAQVYAIVNYTIADSCSDTDGGDVKTIQGTASGYLNEQSYSHTDYCTDSSNVNEYYCSVNHEQSQIESCGTDFYSSSFCIGNNVYKNFTDYYCSSGACSHTTTPQWQQNCTAQQYCSAGACHYTNSCSDTDGGNQPLIFGTVSGYYADSWYSKDDNCIDSSNLMEWYCSGTYKINQTQSCGTDGYTSGNYCYSGDVYKNYTDYYCSSGACSHTTTPQLQQDCTAQQYCLGGACYWSNSCTDSDGGLVYTVKGNVTGYYGGYPYAYTDWCNSTVLLREYYCTGSYWSNVFTSCASNLTTQCSGGKCI